MTASHVLRHWWITGRRISCWDSETAQLDEQGLWLAIVDRNAGGGRGGFF